ncbi:histone H2A.Z-specific chaperone CHZ1 [Impatiens glandulifera]|uniref:histone H2A.Z-specific chaperone CHZ1 n=1 Tax=Impatiens glandulifera TaxID=253017 RepID=UPI001FB14EC9|nr:histone H2A.Z-specific chaperone CHZ1 [Impatiens glandulifera]XP_047342241.1 histone H2A.Z-specific chaperone CHZ1 [Impatiens glandulifera]
MEATQEKEGQYLLGEPTYIELENGRFKCVETGHELPAHNKESYAHTKHCRLGLIDAALAANKPPLNMFLQDPASRSKLSCKLTGDTVNKSEEHIWKHINGRRFLNVLEKKEIEKQTPSATAMVVEKSPQKPKKKKSKLKVKKEKHKKKEEEEEENGVEMQNSSEKEDSETTDIEGFWMPAVGERWDFDNGADRWGSGSESDEQEETEEDEIENETDDDDDANAEENNKEDTLDISKRTKRMCIEIDSSNLASAAKKKKKKTA